MKANHRSKKSLIKLRDIYRTYMGRRCGQDVWVVDWNNVCKLFPDWIMGGNDQRYRFNPVDEVWIDASMGIEEYEYTLRHEFLEREMMRDRLWTYNRAHNFANATLDTKLRAANEKRAARKLAQLRLHGHPRGYTPGMFDGIYKAFNGMRLKNEVWVVDGSLVRKRFDPDFAFPGAHHFRRPYVPNGEFWLDAATSSGQLILAMVELTASHRAFAAGATPDQAYAAGYEAREKERLRQARLAEKHEKQLPPVRPGARARGVSIPRNH